MKLLNSLWAKISLAIVLMVMLIMAITTYIFTISQIKSQRAELELNMGRLAKQIASIRLAQTEGYYVYQDWIDNIISSDFNRDLVYIAIFDESDSLRAFALNYAWLDLEDNVYLSREEQAEIVVALSQGQIAEESKADFGHVPVDIRWGEEHLGSADVGFSLIEFNDRVQRRLALNLYMLTFFSIIGVFGSVVLSRHITRPLNRLSQGMNEISKGNLNQRVAITSKDEIGTLAHSFNLMTEGLREKQEIEDLVRDLGFSFQIERVMQTTVKRLVRAVQARQGYLFLVLYHENNHRLQWGASFPHEYAVSETIPLSPHFIKICQNEPINCLELAKKDQKVASELLSFLPQPLLQDKIELILPLKSKKILALLFLTGKEKGTLYSREDLSFLNTLCNQAAISLENSILLEELTEQERLKRELEIAREVQTRLLPHEMPALLKFDIHGLCLPALQVGGDYFDFFDLDQGRLGLAIADVSGKGTSASFYMAEIKGMMNTLATIHNSPAEVVRILNERLYRSLDKQLFATMIYGILDSKDMTLRFVRAGHNGLLHIRNNEIKMHIPSGMGLGLAGNEIFDRQLVEQTIELQDNDLILFYTDGISEAMRRDHSEFGEERLAELLFHQKNHGAQRISEEIVKAVTTFVDQAPQHDDLTMIVMKRKNENTGAMNEGKAV
jgi:serine phosphatase RsbU (regulator of sigma subunit)/HAMP domain-containing protein